MLELLRLYTTLYSRLDLIQTENNVKSNTYIQAFSQHRQRRRQQDDYRSL